MQKLDCEYSLTHLVLSLRMVSGLAQKTTQEHFQGVIRYAKKTAIERPFHADFQGSGPGLYKWVRSFFEILPLSCLGRVFAISRQ